MATTTKAPSLFTMPFGKHKGKDIEDLDASYLEWLLEQEWFCSKNHTAVEAIKKELEYREKWN